MGWHFELCIGRGRQLSQEGIFRYKIQNICVTPSGCGDRNWGMGQLFIIARFFTLGTNDILSQVILHCGGLSCVLQDH